MKKILVLLSILVYSLQAYSITDEEGLAYIKSISELMDQRSYDNALQKCDEMLSKIDASDSTSRWIGAAYFFKGRVYHINNDFLNTEINYMNAYRAFERSNDVPLDDVALLYHNIIINCTDNSRNQEIEGFAEYAYEWAEKNLPRKSVELCRIIGDLCTVKSGLGKIQDTKTLAQEMYDNLPPDNSNLEGAYLNFQLYIAIQEGTPIEPIISEILKTKDFPSLTYSGTLLRIFYRYEEAIPLLKYALQLIDEAPSFDINKYIIAIVSLSDVQSKLGLLDEADLTLESSIIKVDSLGLSGNAYVGHLYQSLGTLQVSLEDCENALKNLEIAHNYQEKSYNFGGDYSITLLNLANIYLALGNKVKAKLYADMAIESLQNYMGENKREFSPQVMIMYNNLGLLYLRLGYSDKAINYFNDVIRVSKDNPNFTESYLLAANNLSIVYYDAKKYDEAISLLSTTLQKTKNLHYLDIFYQNLAMYYASAEDNKTQEAFQNYSNFTKSNLIKIFSKFSPNEREAYWKVQSGGLMSISGVIISKLNKSEINAISYDNVLFLNNFQLHAKNSLSKALANVNLQGAETLTARYKLLSTKETLSKKEQDEFNSLEKEILRRLDDYSEQLFYNSSNDSWKDVERSLAKDEGSIEFIMYMIPEKYNFTQNTFDGTIAYGALILKKGGTPQFVHLCNAAELEYYVDTYHWGTDQFNKLYDQKSQALYKTLWSKLEPYLKGCKTIYYSPTDLIRRINIPAIPSGDKRLGDLYNLVQVTSTSSIKDLKSKDYNDYASAAIYGGIKYDVDSQVMMDEAAVYNNASNETNDMAIYRGQTRSGWQYLTGTLREAQLVDDILKPKMPVSLFEQEHANEESFKAFSGKAPSILHIATHGFFLSKDEEIKRNKYLQALGDVSDMELSGILLAGANKAWRGYQVDNMEDGVLTAAEIAKLDLSKVKLIVLSACETGLGKDADMDIDGTYGLQRALKNAGVGTIVMSLWKIEDNATQILMAEFYKNLLSGMEKHQALWQAQKYLREYTQDGEKVFSSPEYWASFVIVD